MWSGIDEKHAVAHNEILIPAETALPGFYILQNHHRMIWTTNAVVCGGMLAVRKEACCTLTRRPGTSLEKLICRPIESKTTVFGETLNRIMVAGFPSLMVMKNWFRVSMLMILPMVMFPTSGRPEMRIRYACACGGLLLVILVEKVAWTIIPVCKSSGVIRSPFSSKRIVLPETIRVTSISGALQRVQLL